MPEMTGFNEPGPSYSGESEPNMRDYFLQDGRTKKTRVRDAWGVQWRSADDLVKTMTAREIAAWTPEQDVAESLLSQSVGGGGLYGLDPVAYDVRRGLIALGTA